MYYQLYWQLICSCNAEVCLSFSIVLWQVQTPQNYRIGISFKMYILNFFLELNTKDDPKKDKDYLCVWVMFWGFVSSGIDEGDEEEWGKKE